MSTVPPRPIPAEMCSPVPASVPNLLALSHIPLSLLELYATPHYHTRTTDVNNALAVPKKPYALIRYNSHPSLPLQIYNYTDHVLYRGQAWDPITRSCRSLVIESTTGNVIARGLPKFFNWHESMAYKPTGAEARVVVEEKVDGSIALLFWYEGQWRWASRGTFDGTHVALFEEIWRDTGGKEREGLLVKGLTYVFEMVHPDNTICVQYSDRREMVLLSVFATNGREPPETEWIANPEEKLPFSRPQVFEASDLMEDNPGVAGLGLNMEKLSRLPIPNAEGFVLKFYLTPTDPRPERVKVKLETYLDLMRIKNSTNPAEMLQLYKDYRRSIMSLRMREDVEPAMQKHKEKYLSFLAVLADDFGGVEWLKSIEEEWDRIDEVYTMTGRRLEGLLNELTEEGILAGSGKDPKVRRELAGRVNRETKGVANAVFDYLKGSEMERIVNVFVEGVRVGKGAVIVSERR